MFAAQGSVNVSVSSVRAWPLPQTDEPVNYKIRVMILLFTQWKRSLHSCSPADETRAEAVHRWTACGTTALTGKPRGHVGVTAVYIGQKLQYLCSSVHILLSLLQYCLCHTEVMMDRLVIHEHLCKAVQKCDALQWHFNYATQSFFWVLMKVEGISLS